MNVEKRCETCGGLSAGCPDCKGMATPERVQEDQSAERPRTLVEKVREAKQAQDWDEARTGKLND